MKPISVALSSCLALALLAAPSVTTLAHAQTLATTSPVWDRTKLPLADPPFIGKIGKTYQDSTAAWPPVPAPPAGAPNVVIIVLDDVGFGQVSTFDGPVPTPNLDRFAA